MNELWAAALVALWVVVILIGLLLAGALRQIGLFQLRLGDDLGALITDIGLDRGAQGPDFEVIDAKTGDRVRLSELPVRPRFLVFVTPTCLACQQLAPHLNEVMKTRKQEFDFVVVCTGDESACRAFAHAYRLEPTFLIDESTHASEAYDVKMTPFAYVLDDQRRVLIRGIANNWLGFEALMEQEGVLQVGTVWSKVETRDLDDEAQPNAVTVR
jgi:methylamine dehydrogenase accessory protein MauD